MTESSTAARRRWWVMPALAVLGMTVGACTLDRPDALAPAQSTPSSPGVVETVTPTPDVLANPTGSPPVACSTEPAQCYPPAVNYYFELLPAPCAQQAHASDALIVSRRAEHRSWGDPSSGTTAYDVTLTRYGGGAQQYLTELRTSLSACRTVDRPANDAPSPLLTITYRSAGTVPGGDESILVSRSYEYVSEGLPTSHPVFLIAVVRIGGVIAVVYDKGWEGSPTPRATFDRFVADAIASVRAGQP